MGLGEKTVTLGEVVAAMQANGLEKHRGWARKNSHDEIVAACSIAQAAIRLEIDYYGLETALNQIEVFNGGPEPQHLASFIISLNDNTGKSVSAIGDEAARRVQALRLMPLKVARKTYKVAATAKL